MTDDFPDGPLHFRGHVSFLLIAFAAALIVLGARWSFIERAGSPVPFQDQWFAEAEHLYLPALHGNLSVVDFVKPHNDHRIVPTRLLAYALLRANGIWDVRLQMVVNAAIAAALCFPLLAIIRPWLSPALLVIAGALLAWFSAAPILYENALWGFQSQFYFLIHFSLLQLLLMLGCRPLSPLWWLGVAAGVCALASMASGVLSSIAVLSLAAFRFVRSPDERATSWPTLAASMVLVALGCWWLPSSPSAPISFNFASVLHTAGHALAFPERTFSFGGLLIWLPFVCFSAAAIRRRALTCTESVLFGVGLWVLFQIGAMAFMRPIDGPVLPNRYYDILTVGLVVNIGCLFWWGRQRFAFPSRTSTVAAAISIGFLWVGWCGWHAIETTRIHRYQLEPLFTTLRDEQIRRIKSYVRANDISAIRDSSYPHIPVVEPSSLENLLHLPEIRAILPWELRDPIHLNFPSSLLNNALPNTVPNEPGMLHRGTFIAPTNSATTIDETSAPAAKREGTRLLFEVAGDFKAGETELRIHDEKGTLIGSITNLQSDTLRPIVVRVQGTRFAVEVVDRSQTRWIAFVEPVEIGPLSTWVQAAVPLAPWFRGLGLSGLATLLLCNIRPQPRLTR